ncbi:MAG: trimethylamine methyltransferase family protein [Lentisphaerae bacterium]|nr:trimethylamine methyltransferase family protein [Lentisphaerota bacterium]
MRTNLTNYATTQFRVLANDQIEQIFLAALEIIEGTGSRILENEAKELLKKAGAVLQGDIARIPSSLVKEMLGYVPERIALGNRNGQRTMVLESHRIYYGTGSDCPFIYDAQSGARRLFRKQDAEEAARLVDACENLDFHMSLGLVSDVPTYSYDRHQAAAMLRNTVKPLCLTAMSRAGLADIVEMYYLLRGARDAFEVNPGFIAYLEPTTPLLHSKAALEKLIFAAERRIPAIYTPCPMLGATAPATLAGALALAVAEFLVGLVIAQLKRQGAPLLMGGVISPVDMRSMVLTYGSPELHLLSGALTDIAHWLKIPVFSTAGCSDSKVFDQQAAAEAALSIMAAGLSGANLIHDVGFLESALIASPEMVVLSNEIIGMVKRFLAGVQVNEETLALDVIKEVGPGGNFLAHEHTAEHFRSEFFFPALMDRNRFEIWQKAGSRDMGARVRGRVADILSSHKVPPLPEKVEAGISKILAAADKKASADQTSLVA